MSDLIDRQAAIDAVHKSIFDFFDICDDDEESPMTYQDEKLLEINKAITLRIKQLPSAQSSYTDEQIQKMQELEQAELEKAFELGREEGRKEAQPKMGKWIKGGEQPYFRKHFDIVVCAICNKRGEHRWNFCPNCGADMRTE